MNRELVYKKVKEYVTKTYDIEQSKLVQIGIYHKTEGEIRYAAGVLVERILQSIIDAINSFLVSKINSKVGSSDYLTKTIIYKNIQYVNNSIQVDRHLWYKGKRVAFIENKTYLDTCYYDRALADFKKITQALEQAQEDPSSCEYIVFAGQKAGKNNTFLTYEAEFWYETKTLLKNSQGIIPHIIYFLQGTRNSSKPLYKIKHILDYNQINKLVDILLDKIEE